VARNYRKIDGGITAWGLVCRLILFLVFVAFGLSIVMQETRTQKVGKEIKDVEESIAELRNANMMLQAQLSDLKTPRALVQKAEQWQLGLKQVSQIQVVKCKEPTGKDAWVYAKSTVAPVRALKPAARARPTTRQR
jgi:cell division protein FtsL